MDTISNLPTPSGSIWDSFWMIAAILVAVYEILIRYIPTIKDYTIIGFIYKILDLIIENRAKVTPEEEEGVKLGKKQTTIRKKFTIRSVIEKIFD
jgi:hypothetical protein